MISKMRLSAQFNTMAKTMMEGAGNPWFLGAAFGMAVIAAPFSPVLAGVAAATPVIHFGVGLGCKAVSKLFDLIPGAAPI